MIYKYLKNVLNLFLLTKMTHFPFPSKLCNVLDLLDQKPRGAT